MKLGDIAALVGGKLEGAAGMENAEISGVAGLDEAGPRDITYLAKPGYLERAVLSRALCVVVQKYQPALGKTQLVVNKNPQLAFIELLQAFHKKPPEAGGTSPLAFVSGDARICPGATVYPFCYVGAGAEVGARSVLYPGVFVGAGSVIGEDCVLYPNVAIREGVRVGSRVIIHSGAEVGSDGFGFVFHEGRHLKIPQVGGVVIEDDVEIGSCTTIDRATTGNTVIGRGTKIDNLVQIAHNVSIGQGAILVAQAGVAGSCRLGNFVTLAGQVGVGDHVVLEDGTVLGARAAVMPGERLKKGAYLGSPIMPHREFFRSIALFERLPEIYKTLQRLEQKIAELERRVSISDDDEHKRD